MNDLGPFTVHGSRSWMIGGDSLTVKAVAREGSPAGESDAHAGTAALVVITRSDGAVERAWAHVGDAIVFGGRAWTISRVGDRGRMAEWSGHESLVAYGGQPGRFVVFAPANRSIADFELFGVVGDAG